MVLEVVNRDLGLSAFGAGEADRRAIDSHRAVVEQPFVAVADLLDVERLVADPLRDRAPPGPHLDVQESIEDGEDCSVVDGDGSSGPGRYVFSGAEVDSTGHDVVWGAASFEEGEAFGVEEAAAIGGEGESIMIGAAVDGAAGGEQSVPGGGAPFECVLAVTGRDCTQFVP